MLNVINVEMEIIYEIENFQSKTQDNTVLSQLLG